MEREASCLSLKERLEKRKKRGKEEEEDVRQLAICLVLSCLSLLINSSVHYLPLDRSINRLWSLLQFTLSLAEVVKSFQLATLLLVGSGCPSVGWIRVSLLEYFLANYRIFLSFFAQTSKFSCFFKQVRSEDRLIDN